VNFECLLCEIGFQKNLKQNEKHSSLAYKYKSKIRNQLKTFCLFIKENLLLGPTNNNWVNKSVRVFNKNILPKKMSYCIMM